MVLQGEVIDGPVEGQRMKHWMGGGDNLKIGQRSPGVNEGVMGTSAGSQARMHKGVPCVQDTTDHSLSPSHPAQDIEAGHETQDRGLPPRLSCGQAGSISVLFSKQN